MKEQETTSSPSATVREFYEEKQRQLYSRRTSLSKINDSNKDSQSRRFSLPKESLSGQHLFSTLDKAFPESPERDENNGISEDFIRPTSQRKTSLYELKQVAAPVPLKGRRISLRTQSLLEQYEKDMSSDKIDSAKIEIKEELNQLKHGRRSLG